MNKPDHTSSNCPAPEGVHGDNDVVLNPVCEPEIEEADVCFVPPMASCPEHLMPKLKATLTCVEPCWKVCPSTPPTIECPPLKHGWGQHDGGKHWWADIEYDPAKCPDHHRRNYLQVQWESTLDHETSTSFHGQLPFYRNNQIAKMTAQVFINMARKLACIAASNGWLASADSIPKQELFGLSYVVTGQDANGKPTYGLSSTYDGTAIGTPLPLDVTRDANGVATGVALPLALIIAAEA